MIFLIDFVMINLFTFMIKFIIRLILVKKNSYLDHLYLCYDMVKIVYQSYLFYILVTIPY